MAGSSIPGFYKRGRAERIALVREASGISEADARVLAGGDGGLTFEAADRMSENVIGTFALPLGVATNFIVNGRDVLVPMAIEEPSVVAAASRGARAARPRGGFRASGGESISVGQIQLVGADPARAAAAVREGEARILAAANSASSTLASMGRGARSVSCRAVATDAGEMVLVELEVDVADAMGANATNSMCEAAAPVVEELAGGRALLRILSNYSDRRLARASATFDAADLGGENVVDDMLLAYQLAKHDVRRAVTHNKGVMNGCAAVAAATGQDVRAIEAAAHAWAARAGRYAPLTEWEKDKDGDLAGSIEMPLAVGTVGGIAGVHPAAGACLRVLGSPDARGLAGIIAAAGLAQNLAAMRALASEGIQRGHMRLHARNVAAAAGAPPGRAGEIAERMAREGRVSPARARELLGG